nr:retrotransposon Orf1 [Tanacetum cinerariifolium]
MKRKLDPWEKPNEGVNNFMGRIKGMHVFVGNFTYVIDFLFVEDISSIIYLRLSQVVLGKPFVKISSMTHDPPEAVVRFTNGIDEIAYKIEHYNSLSDQEREHTKSVDLRNEEDKRIGVEYIMATVCDFTFFGQRARDSKPFSRSSRESKSVCGEVGVLRMSSMGSKLMVRGDECLEGCVGASGGEVSGGGDDFRVSKSLLGEIPRVVISEGGGETFLDDGGAIW